MNTREFEAKTIEDAITEACREFLVTSDQLEYEIISEGSNGFLGMGAKPAIIKASVKSLEKVTEELIQKSKATDSEKTGNTDLTGVEKKACEFLKNVFESMKMEVSLTCTLDEIENVLTIDMSGADMGVLIGKRGQTLDALQYLTSLVANQGNAAYIHLKLDTENYRERRKQTLENLAKNIAYKVKRSHRSVSLEPMNPYERRIIHSALQNDKFVTTHSEGDEPYRRVVVTLKYDNN